jgi:hypothetical protein
MKNINRTRTDRGTIGRATVFRPRGGGTTVRLRHRLGDANFNRRGQGFRVLSGARRSQFTAALATRAAGRQRREEASVAEASGTTGQSRPIDAPARQPGTVI